MTDVANMFVSDSIIDQLKTIRKDKELTQAQVATRAGISQGEYSRIENGWVSPRLTTVVAIAEVLGQRLAFEVSEQTKTE